MDENWNEKKYIGDNAESIIKCLINDMSDWECFEFGVENHIKEIREAVITHINPETIKIKSMPDLIAHNKRTGKTIFIEVKYRGFIDKRENGKSEYKIDFLRDYKDNWKGTKLIVVNKNLKPYFFVIDLDEVTDDMHRSEEVERNKYEHYWNFKSIEKTIQELFSNDLTDEILEKAINKLK